jgi:uncharacterized protein (TIGR02757 family)
MTHKQLYHLLEEKFEQYNQASFIEEDPISIPHRFKLKQDIEISGFIAATLAWGQRKTILNNCQRLMQWMDKAPYDFILNHKPKDLLRFEGFVHRTFNYDDLVFMFTALQKLYRAHKSLEALFKLPKTSKNLKEGIHTFRDSMLQTAHLSRSRKHISDPHKNSACKRLNMFLRWMVRDDDRGVDFGLWKEISPAQLSCPLDVHTATVGRKLGMIKRRQNDWKTVEELDTSLRAFDPNDPVKYDFALFGMGVYER